MITAEEPTATLLALAESPNSIRIQTVELDETTLTVDDADPASYQLDVATSNENVVLVWAFVNWGDGEQVEPDPANGFTFTHTYDEPGSYEVQAVVYLDPPDGGHIRSAPTISRSFTATVS